MKGACWSYKDMLVLQLLIILLAVLVYWLWHNYCWLFEHLKGIDICHTMEEMCHTIKDKCQTMLRNLGFGPIEKPACRRKWLVG